MSLASIGRDERAAGGGRRALPLAGRLVREARLTAVPGPARARGRTTSSAADRCGTCSPTTPPSRDGLLPGAQALRLMGAVHRLVLEGRAPGAGRLLSLGRRSGRAGGAARRSATCSQQRRDELGPAARASRADQRAGPLGRPAGRLPRGGARRPGLPLRLLEVGASAGLNLRWDRYFYTAAGGSWGDPGSPVRFDPPFTEGAPPLHVRAADRRAPRLRPRPARCGRPTTTSSRCCPTCGPTRSSASGSCAARSRSRPRCRSRSTARARSSGSSERSPSRATASRPSSSTRSCCPTSASRASPT